MERDPKYTENSQSLETPPWKNVKTLKPTNYGHAVGAMVTLWGAMNKDFQRDLESNNTFSE